MEETFRAGSQAMARSAQTRFKVLGASSFSHFLNDMMQPMIGISVP